MPKGNSILSTNAYLDLTTKSCTLMNICISWSWVKWALLYILFSLVLLWVTWVNSVKSRWNKRNKNSALSQFIRGSFSLIKLCWCLFKKPLFLDPLHSTRDSLHKNWLTWMTSETRLQKWQGKEREEMSKEGLKNEEWNRKVLSACEVPLAWQIAQTTKSLVVP